MEATTNQNPAVMANPKKRMCAHIPCLCTVPDREEYCGPACRDAAREDAKSACHCNHAACPRPIPPFAGRSADQQGL